MSPLSQDGLAAAASPDAKTPARLALATAVLNVSTRVHVSDASLAECAPRAVSVGAELLLSCPADDDDARFRTLVALAQIASDGGAECKSLAKDLGLGDVAEALRVSGGSERVRDAAGDLKLAMSR